MSHALRTVSGLVVAEGRATREVQRVIEEQPLSIRIAGDVVATTMRTPGEDRYLALGYLFGEGVLHGLDDVTSIHHCGRSDDPEYGNAIEVVATRVLDFEARPTTIHSACGVCGRAEILGTVARVANPQPVPASLLERVPRLLEEVQPLFAHSGGAHVACAITREGEVIAHAEDVGRHNAVDKVVGRLLYAGQLARPSLLAVSARAGFEIVQKAARAGFACVASVSAPSSLAIDVAEAAGLTLASFVREGRFTLYAHAERVELAR